MSDENKVGKYHFWRDEALKKYLSWHEEWGVQEFQDFTVTTDWMKNSVSKTLEAFGLNNSK